MWFFRTGLLACLFLLLCLSVGLAAEPFLSHITATKDDPLYTTFAAPLQRSEFVLDQGFEWVFYDSSRGADFTTDTAGDWCMAFKMAGDYVYAVDDMVQQPVITTAYPDLVRYRCVPLPDIQVETFFLCHSSTLAIRDVEITNTSRETKELTFYSFLQNSYRTFDRIQIDESNKMFLFEHEELPDGWVLGHDVPYVSPVYDAWVFSEPMERMTSFRSYRWGNIQLPQVVDIDKERRYSVWGRVTDSKGERCREKAPDARFMVVRNDD
ncbi:hypothetical protein JW992_12610, partial [candidate division KSB1 bacterium]|nr:hypothetical protein [candidate division KSB1 bacterium]